MLTEPNDALDSLRELNLHTYKEVWNDIRTYSSNIWQVIGLSLVAIAFFANMLSTISPAGNPTGLFALVYLIFFLTMILYGFHYAIFELSERIKERIIILQHLEEFYQSEYILIEKSDAPKRPSIFGPKTHGLTRSLSWTLFDDVVEIYLIGWILSLIVAWISFLALASLQGLYGFIFILGALILCMTILLFATYWKQRGKRLDSSRIKRSPQS